jgi:hypothetical protein
MKLETTAKYLNVTTQYLHELNERKPAHVGPLNLAGVKFESALCRQSRGFDSQSRLRRVRFLSS